MINPLFSLFTCIGSRNCITLRLKSFNISSIDMVRIVLQYLVAVAIVAVLPLSADARFYYIDMVPSDSLWIRGRVMESLANMDLHKAFAVPIDAKGNYGDTIYADIDVEFLGMNGVRERSFINLFAPRVDSTYVFEIGAPGYTPKTVVYKVERLGKREMMREMPATVLERAPRQLGEVTVTASKVKFYNKGDTLVYNADAFQLADGSMLDALISQLPGVELNNKGEIRVNGEYVETLLLNGKQFFSSDKKLMLENIGAYTVKDVEVYKGQTRIEKWIDNPLKEKHLTMNVKLKKEYSRGWILNAQGGYGTEDRYMGRLFASSFGLKSNVALIGNINNLNDTFDPSDYGSWRQSNYGTEKNRQRKAGLNYNHESADVKRTIDGSFKFEDNSNTELTTNNGTSFYATGDVYSYSHSVNRLSSFSLSTEHNGMLDLGRVNINGQLSGSYRRSERASSSLSGSFNEEQPDVSAEFLRTIYGNGSAEQLAALINRSITARDNRGRSAEVSGNVTTHYKLPGSSDMLTFTLSSSYEAEKSHDWNDYTINYGVESKPADCRRQYGDNSPIHNLMLKGAVAYEARFRNLNLNLGYDYLFNDRVSDMRMYALERLANMGEYGFLPDGYLDAFDQANSYNSRRWESCHTFRPSLRYVLKTASGGEFKADFNPTMAVKQRHMNYWRDGKSYRVNHTGFMVDMGYSGVRLEYSNKESSIMNIGKDRTTKYVLSYEYSINTTLPEMMDLVDIVDESNPLLIREGNPGLKNAYHQSHSVSWSIAPAKISISNDISVRYEYDTDALVQGVRYDMNTGVSRVRTYNVNGNRSVTVDDRVFWSKGNVYIQSMTRACFSKNVFMSTTGQSADFGKYYTKNTEVSERLNVSWRNRGCSVSFNGDMAYRKTSREGADDIDAIHANYGVNAMITLPAGLSIGTNFTLSTRWGYGDKDLDTTDAVWNANISYAPKNKRWVFMLHGFDLLHSMSSVHYFVSAMGRSVWASNTLPRYILASVQYRFNIQPKQH